MEGLLFMMAILKKISYQLSTLISLTIKQELVEQSIQQMDKVFKKLIHTILSMEIKQLHFRVKLINILNP